jgi:hypothetical protein
LLGYHLDLGEQYAMPDALHKMRQLIVQLGKYHPDVLMG